MDLAEPMSPLAAPSWLHLVPDWLTAFATLGALFAAVWAGRTARRLYEKEHDRDQERAAEKRRAQASQVGAWVAWINKPRIHLKLPSGKTSKVTLAMRNNSAVPVYDVQVAYSAEGRDLGTQSYALLSPTGATPQRREIKSQRLAEFVDEPRDRATRLDIRVAIEFTDANGLRWRRDTAGGLDALGQVRGA